MALTGLGEPPMGAPWITCSFPPTASLCGKEVPSSPPSILALPASHHSWDRGTLLAAPPTRTQPTSVMGEERTTVRKMSGWNKRTNVGRCPWYPLKRHLPRQFTKDPCAPVTKVNGYRKAQGMLKGRWVETNLHRCSSHTVQPHIVHLLHPQKVLQ